MPDPKAPRYADQLALVSRTHLVAPALMLSERRNKELVVARWHLAYRLRAMNLWAFERIGEHMGKDHATIRHGVLRFQHIFGRHLGFQPDLEAEAILDAAEKQGVVPCVSV